MAASLGELFVELGIFADTKELKAFEKKLEAVSKKLENTKTKSNNASISIGKFIKKAAAIATAVTGAYIALSKLTDGLVKSNQEFLNLTRNSDIALTTFQKWNNVGRMLGIRNAAQQLAGLNQRLFELKLTGQGAEGFLLAGINPMGNSAENVMEQLRNRVAKLDDTAATFLLTKMGLDPSMLHILRLGRQEFEALAQAVNKYQLTEEQRKQIQRLNIQLEIARIQFGYLKDRAILAIMPAFVRLTQFLVSAAEGFGRFVNWVMKGKGVFAFLTRSVLGLAAALGVLKAALWALSAHPIIAAITAILGALMLLFDDLNHYFNGGGSLIGVIMYKLNQTLESIQTPQWIKDLLYVIANIDNIPRAINNIRQGNVGDTKVGDAVKPALDLLTMPIFGASGITAKFLEGALRDMNGGNTETNNNANITMNNTINTSQTGVAVANDLMYAQSVAYSVFS